ncbi:MAG: hypothetical protein DSM106950_34335 [Stigonema ocellatum SAG 48.90 = DSM 106950]|nr:hypothetical protein [Stigonema ocellatum SAG 48.90 = DSM 106950]
MQYYFSNQPANNSAHVNSNSHADTDTSTLIGFSILSFPIVLLLGVITYKKYRAAVLRRQIATLEKIWLIKLKNNTYKQD